MYAVCLHACDVPGAAAADREEAQPEPPAAQMVSKLQLDALLMHVSGVLLGAGFCWVQVVCFLCRLMCQCCALPDGQQAAAGRAALGCEYLQD
jgi:hypothetical protein